MCMTMTERIEIITGVERRRRYSVEQKVRLVEETQLAGDNYLGRSTTTILAGEARWF